MSNIAAHLLEDLLPNPDEVIGRALHRLEVHGSEKHLEEEDMDTLTAAPARKYLGPKAHELQFAGWKPKERCGKTIWQSPENELCYSREIASRLLENGGRE